MRMAWSSIARKAQWDQECMVGGSVKAQGYIGGQPTKPEPSTLKPKLRALFRPQGEGWRGRSDRRRDVCG
jgi:hypothetical protein